ncbi:GGDEF domain-containing protein [Corallincola platygyrae]|uniref:diguanylate cyclase n=1 Tax=Corallincola platygyrae TaxID=1193278 RepID=A0ABW4XIL8_9GAMM
MLSAGHSSKFALLLHVLMLIPLSAYGVYHIGWESHIVGVVLIIAALPLALSVFRLAQGKDNSLYSKTFIIVVCMALLGVCYQLGIRGLIYTFGAASMLFFIFGFRAGLVLSVVYTILSIALSLNAAPSVLVFKFSIGIGLSLLFTAFFAYEVETNQKALERQANRDPLTGVFNRRMMSKALAQAIDYGKRYRRHCSLICIDLDHFKEINDTHGHTVGDEVLKQAANCISRTIRGTDSLYRFGGEEFAVLLPETEQMDAMAVAEKLRESLVDHSFDCNINLTASFGVAEMVIEESADSWLKRADDRLYEAKTSGRNRVV